MSGLEVEPELELIVKELSLGQGALQHCTGVTRRGVLLLAHCAPAPACAESPSRQAACLPPSSASLHFPGISTRRAWTLALLWVGKPQPLSGFTPFWQAGLQAFFSLLFLQWVSPFSVPSTQVPYPFLFAESQHPGDFP